MEIRKTQNGDICVLALSGRIDTLTSPRVQESLTETISSSSCGKIELDFAEVSYLSSAALRILLTGAQGARAAGKTMTLKNVSAEVMKIFEVTGFSRILTIG